MRLTEARNILSEAFKWRWKRLEAFEAEAVFKATGETYYVWISLSTARNAKWEIVFGRGEYGDIHTTGTGMGISVFSTVGEVVSDFIRRYDPEVFYFTGARKRHSLYARFADKLAKKYGYEMIPSKNPNAFVLAKQGAMAVA